MRTVLIRMALLFSMALSITSCAPSIYLPPPTQATLFEGKGDFQVQGGVGTSGIFGQAGYAISDQVGVTASISRASRKADSTGADFRRHLQADVAAVYYREFSGSGVVELLAGAGLGSMQSRRTLRQSTLAPPDFRYDADVSYARLFIQGNIGVRNSEVWDINTLFKDVAFSFRVTYPLYTSFAFQENEYLRRNGLAVDTVRKSYAKPAAKFFIYEPALVYRFGGEKVKGFTQLGVYLGPDTGQKYYGSFISFHLGLQLALQFDKKNSKTEPGLQDNGESGFRFR